MVLAIIVSLWIPALVQDENKNIVRKQRHFLGSNPHLKRDRDAQTVFVTSKKV